MTTTPSTTPFDCSVSARQLAAETLLQRHSWDLSTLKPQAVPVGRIAASIGATIRFKYGIAHGALIARPEGYTIIVDKRLKPARQRYTIAHELGHLLLARRRETLPKGFHLHMTVAVGNEEVETSDEERFCDVFASYLLLPQNAYSDFHDWQSLSITELVRIAHTHQVSIRALAWQVVESMPSPGGVLFFRKMGKPSDLKDEQLRLDWGYFPMSSQLYLPRYDRVTQKPLLQLANAWDEQLMDVKLEFGSLRGWRTLRAKRIAQPADIIAFVFPTEQEDFRPCDCTKGA